MCSRMAALSLCVLALLVLAIPPAHPQTLMENSRIAFVTNRDGNAEIYVMRVDGSELVNLTNSRSGDIDPAWSPDGAKIAFASDRDGDFDIHTMGRDGSNVTQLTHQSGRNLHPSWSADGERIMFASDRVGDTSTIFIMDSDGTNQTQITATDTGGWEPAWSPDISRMAYSAPGTPDAGTRWIVTLLFGRLSPSISYRRKGSGRRGSPAWSHGGWGLAWEESNGDDYDLWVRPYGNSTIGAPGRLTSGPEDDRDPTWSPDGESLAFRRDGDIWRISPADSVATLLIATSGVDRDPVWSPFIDLPPDPLATTQIAFGGYTWQSHEGIYVVNHDGTDAHWIVRDAEQPKWSPDGTKFAFASEDEPLSGGTDFRNSEIWVMDVDGSDHIRLTADAAGGPDDTQPTWAPDGSQVAFVSDRDGNPELYVVRVDGTDMRRLTFTSDWEESPAWSPDGSRIAFTRVFSPGVYLLEVPEGGVTQIPNVGRTGHPAWSPDGSRIAGDAGSDGIRLIDVAWPHAQTWLGTGRQPAWSPDGRQIAFLSTRDDGNTLAIYLMNADGSRPRRLLDTVPASHHSAPTWSPFLGPGAARITILDPADGETLPFNTQSVTFRVDIDLHSGGWRWRSNARFPTEGPIGGNVGDDTRRVTIPNLAPGKSYTIRTALVTDAGELLSPNATHTVTFSVAPVPIVTIVSPVDGREFVAGTREAPLSVDVQHHDAHWHYRVNEAFPESGLAGGNHVDAGSSATIPQLRDGVTYTAHAALVDDEHNLLDPSIVTSSTFTTGDPTYIIGTVLPKGLSLFALPLAAERLRFFGMATEEARELDLTTREGGLTAFDLIAIGSTICVRMDQGQMQAVVGREGVPLFGSDFPIEPARGYVVNMLEDIAIDIEGPPFGARLAAPSQDAAPGENWAFVVAGNVGDGIHVPTGTRVRIRSGERVVTTPVTAAGAFLTAFVDSTASASVVSGEEALLIDAVAAGGYLLGGARPERVTGVELRDAFKVVTLDFRPTRAQLLPNYPNPFNPETWIPFELAQAGRVDVRVYGLAGQLVRRIDLGARGPGYYVTRADAARWDGRNDAGETVGSGVYMVELRAGASRDVRRLLIGK